MFLKFICAIGAPSSSAAPQTFCGIRETKSISISPWNDSTSSACAAFVAVRVIFFSAPYFTKRSLGSISTDTVRLTAVLSALRKNTPIEHRFLARTQMEKSYAAPSVVTIEHASFVSQKPRLLITVPSFTVR